MAAIEGHRGHETDAEISAAIRDERVEPAVSPSRLAGRAYAEGYPIPSLKEARYLEINCGTGANLMGLAAACPEVSFTGTSADPNVDIPSAAYHAKIQNIHLGELDLRNFESALGTYEFIVANDVFASASTSERMALLLMTKKHLADDGVACIDLDLYPGWHVVENLREALGYNIDKEMSAVEKVTHMRARIGEMIEGIQTGKYPDRRQDLVELKRLATGSDADIFSALLDPKHRACSISDFMEMVDAASLKPIGDIDPLKTNPAVLPAALRPEPGSQTDLKTLLPEIDQYANTRRRSVLLCHINREQAKHGLLETLDEFFITSALSRTDAKLTGAQLLKAASATFDGPIKYQTSNQVEIVTLALLEQNKHFPILAGRLVGHVASALRKAGVRDVATRDVGGAIAELCGKLLPTGALVTHATETRAINKLNDQPTLSPLALYQIRQGEEYLTSLTPHRVHVDDVARFILGRFDGTQTLQQIYDDVKGAVAREEISIPAMGDTPDARAQAVVLRILAHAGRSGLLIA